MKTSLQQWSNIDFGRYEGLTFPQLVFTDPDYFFWGVEKGAFKRALQVESELITKRAQRIKPPLQYRDDSVIQHWIDRDGRYFGFDIIPGAQGAHAGSGTEVRQEFLDLSFPRKLQAYDKLGYQLMLKSFKCYYFGDARFVLTKRRCEQFFGNEGNFR